jgi:hypothetical protein
MGPSALERNTEGCSRKRAPDGAMAGTTVVGVSVGVSAGVSVGSGVGVSAGEGVNGGVGLGKRVGKGVNGGVGERVGAGVGEGVNRGVGERVGAGDGVGGIVGKRVFFVGAEVPAKTHAQHWTARLADVSAPRVKLVRRELRAPVRRCAFPLGTWYEPPK